MIANKYIEAARAEIAEYHAQIRAGGEPVYPQHAVDLIAIVDFVAYAKTLHIFKQQAN